MKRVGAGELKVHAGKILRRVREGRESFEITWHGRAIARLVPVRPARTKLKEPAKIWADLDRLSEEIGARWPSGVQAVDAVREQRRCLKSGR